MSYQDSGFDKFLSRSIDNNPQSDLDSTAPVSTQMRFDGAQTSGSVGDKVTIGSITLDGAKGRITISDDAGNIVVILGELDG